MGSNNLWYQTGHYVWNPPGDPFSIALQASDPSGVCDMYAIADTIDIPGPSAIAGHLGVAAVPRSDLDNRSRAPPSTRATIYPEPAS